MSGSKGKAWLKNVPITPEEKAALIKVAERNRRDPRQQASVYIRAGLELDGLLGEGVEVAHAAIEKVKGEQ